ncbi:helix-turn-helix transcriptional regulator [Asanoa ishikariensis]|uniref:Regulatory protein, luxR family n=1 Tax=Asanoa ishikariensis TaxID=137265 RepID=A0A1H3UXA5_9ACTN|nr:LuxR family transcriptional regulator [Asanoa ishikariensis]GIF69961.1 helix-turn-helix transcriptional regulator [Asanoa ishikariensis]SDZ67072.1 regulatory protein, luxR family [Asanoa ishikariensis]
MHGSAGLTGRRTECAVLDDLVKAVRGGASQVLVLHGEAGVGKTALLDHVAARVGPCRVVRAAGVESEMELPYAGVHQLCGPLLDLLDRLPTPQREALGTTFGISAGPPPERFLVGLAVLSLLSAVAADRPLVCLVDDLEWLDRESAQVLAFVARRLEVESVGLVLAARAVPPSLAHLPSAEVGALPDPDARALLDAALAGPIDIRVRDQIVAEAHGNPLALLELPRGIGPADLAGGFGLPAALTGGIESQFQRRVDQLPEPTRRLLLLMAADPSGDAALVARAAQRWGVDRSAFGPAADAGLTDEGVRFRHPLARSAVYLAAPADERRAAHEMLAAATDARTDPDRRAWHRAAAAATEDEDVAVELERSAGRAQARGGPAAAAAFLRRAAALSPAPAKRGVRALAAAQAEVRAGGFEAARDLLATAAAAPLTDQQRAQADLTSAELAFVTDRGHDAAPLLLQAAQRLEQVDAALSRATYLEALSASIFAGRFAVPSADVRAVARAARAAPPAPAPCAADLLLDGTALSYDEGYVAGLPVLRAALARLRSASTASGDDLNLLWMAVTTTLRVWDDDGWDALSDRYLRLARETGALGHLPLALTARAYLQLFSGNLATAASLTDEMTAITEATGSSQAPYGALGLAAFRGDASAGPALVSATKADVARRGEGVGLTFAEWAYALLHNSLGNYPEALAAAERATAYPQDPGSLIWAAPELVESAVRTGRPSAAHDVFALLTDMRVACGTDWALGIQSRSEALLTDSEPLYRSAIEHLGRTRMRVDLARAHLLYGEWLRRRRRRTDARAELRTAYDTFTESGATAFAARAGRELSAAGGNTHPRAPARDHNLTTQESQIARMAGEGLSNPEIATRLFISARTVQYHLRKVFTKLGITSRTQLPRVLPTR